MKSVLVFLLSAIVVFSFTMAILRLGYQWGKREGDKAVKFEQDYCRARLETCGRDR